MRLIDADVLQVQVQQKRQPTIASERHREGWNQAMLSVKSMIHSAPTIERGEQGSCGLCNGITNWVQFLDGNHPEERFNYCPRCGRKVLD